MFSNRPAISHMIQCAMPFSRSAMAVAAATAPTPTWPFVHSHSASPVVAEISTMLSMWFTISNWLTSRICACAVIMNSRIAARA